MSAAFSYLPQLSVFDPRDSAEGTIDPLGLAQLSGRIADELVPGFTERVHRPRFFTALALGARVLSRPRYEGGTYGDHEDGPAYLAWERLVVEAFARKGQRQDAGLRGVPGIQKARAAASQGARLSSQLHLKNAAAVGWWVAYKGLAVDTGIIDKNGNLGEAGIELLGTWARAIGQPDLVRSDSATLRELDDALAPLLDHEKSTWNPQKAWAFLIDALHPGKIDPAEGKCILRLLRENGDEAERRQAIIDYLDDLLRTDEKAFNDHEDDILAAIEQFEPLAKSAALARSYETLAREITTAFECVLFAGKASSAGKVSAAIVCDHPQVGDLFQSAPGYIKAACLDASAKLEVSSHQQLARWSLDWIKGAALEDPAALFEALLTRHFEVQRGKPPDGKRPWIEGEAGAYFVRLRFVPDSAPKRGTRVFTYRTAAVRSVIAEIRRARQ